MKKDRPLGLLIRSKSPNPRALGMSCAGAMARARTTADMQIPQLEIGQILTPNGAILMYVADQFPAAQLARPASRFATLPDD